MAFAAPIAAAVGAAATAAQAAQTHGTASTTAPQGQVPQIQGSPLQPDKGQGPAQDPLRMPATDGSQAQMPQPGGGNFPHDAFSLYGDKNGPSGAQPPTLGADLNAQPAGDQAPAPDAGAAAGKSGDTFMGLSGTQWGAVGQASSILAKLFEAHKPDVVGLSAPLHTQIPYVQLGPDQGAPYRPSGLGNFTVTPPSPGRGVTGVGSILDELKRAGGI